MSDIIAYLTNQDANVVCKDCAVNEPAINAIEASDLGEFDNFTDLHCTVCGRDVSKVQ